jgi:hypothetical protein
MLQLRHVAVRVVLAAAIACALAACKKASADYCTGDGMCPDDEHCDVPNMICISDLAPDAEPIPCDVDHPCNAQGPLPFCDGTQCVVCGEGGPSACPDEQPICVDNSCAACANDTDCPSGVCMDDGSCADEADVLYADPAGLPTSPCTRSMPCDLPTAVGMLTTSVNVIHLAAGTMPYALTVPLNVGLTSTLIGRGAVIEYTSGTPGPVFNLIAGSRTITFAFVTIQGGKGALPQGQGDGIACAAGTSVVGRQITITGNAAAGIYTAGCNVTLSGSRLSSNPYGLYSDGSTTEITGAIIRDNTLAGIKFSTGSLTVKRSTITGNGGGIDSDGSTLMIENNVIALNGTGFNDTGGISVAGTGTRVIRFNTIARNVTNGVPTTIYCNLGTTIEGSNNIIDGTISAECSSIYSLFTTGPMPAGIGNTVGDPMFIDEPGAPPDPLPAGFFRIEALSAARDRGENTLDVPDDIDGESRPEGSLPDIGADERH